MVETVAIGTPPPLGSLSESARVALFLDFDGTLVDIAPSPESILVPEGLAGRLEGLAERLGGRVALISGRSTSNIAAHLGPVRLPRAGSHGVERLRADGSRIGAQPEALPDAAEHAVRSFVEGHEGLEFEEKAHGAALHFRSAPGLESEVIDFAENIAEKFGLAVKQGKCVAELVHRGVDKAGAVHVFMAERLFSGAVPVFIGDDVTDEDGFRAAIELGGFGVIVGDRPDTLARYRLASPEKVHEWLEL